MRTSRFTEEQVIRSNELAEELRRFDSSRVLMLLRREGWMVDHKRVERVYRQEGLSMRQRRRGKRPSHLRGVRPGPHGANQHWAMDFVSDSLADGRCMRVPTVVDLRGSAQPLPKKGFDLTRSKDFGFLAEKTPR